LEIFILITLANCLKSASITLHVSWSSGGEFAGQKKIGDGKH